MSKGLLSILNVPNIDANLTSDEVLSKLIPKGFESIFQASLGTNGQIELTFMDAETNGDKTIVISEYLYNPEKHGAMIPKFIFQISTLVSKEGKRPDYTNQNKNLILNSNQVLYLIIHHRVTKLAAYNTQWIGLLNKDISKLKSFIDFNMPNSFNAKQKVLNTYVVVDAFAKNSNSKNPTWKKVLPYDQSEEFPLGELIDKKASPEVLKATMSDLNIHPGSESMLEKAGKIVMNESHALYKAPGYYMANKTKDNKICEPFVVMPFPVKQNVPSRLKSHLLTDCFKVVEPILNPVYDQDYVKVDDEIKVKDECLLGAIIIFHDIEVESGRFVFGEIEQNIKLAKRQIFKKQTVHQQFSYIVCEVGTTAYNGKLILGTDLNDDVVLIDNVIDAKVTAIIKDEGHQSAKIVVETIIEAGNSRIINPYGLKGFTKTKPYLGYITLPNGEKREVDLITGMNGVKGKNNTIAAARAALAFKKGFYENNLNYLRSLNLAEMNAAAEKIQRLEYTDQYGNKKLVWAGYVEYYVTEIGKMYSKYKPQNFMFEVGKYLEMQTDKSLFNFIWKDCIDFKMKEIAIELHKILTDNNGFFAAKENLPVYTPSELSNLFKSSDFILSSQSRWDNDSKLFDEEFNKGFYIDLRKLEFLDKNNVRQKGPMIRMPSAKTLNGIKGQLQNGSFIYPKLIVATSRILQHLCVKDAGGRYNPGYVWNLSGKKHALQAYLEECTGMLYSNDEKSMTYAQSLIKPKMMGINMKQVTDYLVPWNVVVIFDDKKYHEIEAHIASEDFENKHLGALSLFGKEIYGLAIRNPALWKTQLAKVKIWNKDKFFTYLRECGYDPHMHISPEYCKDCIVISTYLALIQHSDVD